MISKPKRLPAQVQPAFAALVALALAACTQTTSPSPAPPPSAVATFTPNPLLTPGGSGCSGEIARFRAVLKNDVDTGNVGQSVFNRANADLDRSEAACAAGRDTEARSMLASTKSRFGYR